MLGLPISAALGFGAGWGPRGLWWGFVLGLGSAAVLLTWRFQRRVRLFPATTPEAADVTPEVQVLEE